MSLRAVIAVVRARWPLVLIPVALAAVVVFVGTADSGTKYEATATVRVTSRSSLLGATVRPDDLAYLDRLLNTYERLATTKQMLTRLDARVGPGTLDANVRARPNTELLDVTITAENGRTAVHAANTLALLLIERVEALSETDLAAVDSAFEQRMRAQEQRITDFRRQRARLAAQGAQTADVDTQIRLLSAALVTLRSTFEENRLAREAQGRTVTLVDRASPDTVDTIGSGLVSNLVLAIVLGGLAGVGLALLAERLHPAPHTVDEIGRALDVPVIGVFPSIGAGGTSNLLEPGAADTVKRLAAIASARILHDGVRTIAVVGAERREGRTTVAAALAVGLARSGRKVLLVDGDFRAPSVHETFGVANTFGLSGLLTNPKATLGRATVETSLDNLDLVTAGTAAVRTIDVTGPRLQAVLEEAEGRYDVVLVDTSALRGDVDALQLAFAVDGVLLVAGGRSTRWATLEWTAGQLQKMGARLLGVVGNRWVDDISRDQYRDPEDTSSIATSGNGSAAEHGNGTPAGPAGRPLQHKRVPVAFKPGAAASADDADALRTSRRTLGSD